IAAHFDPALTWGDQSTWAGLWWHLTRRDFGTFRLGAFHSGSQFFPGLIGYIGHIGRETFLVGAVLAVRGLARHLRRGRLLPRVSVMALLFYLLGFHALANLPLENPFYREVHARFWQQADVIVFTWVGIGVAGLGALAAGKGRALLTALAPACVLVQF